MNAEKFYYYLCIISFVVDIKKVYNIFFSLFLFPPHQKFLINDGVLQCVGSSQKFRLSIESKQIRNENERGTKMRRTKTWNHQKKISQHLKINRLNFLLFRFVLSWYWTNWRWSESLFFVHRFLPVLCVNKFLYSRNGKYSSHKNLDAELR